jgi:hypothetical protein
MLQCSDDSRRDVCRFLDSHPFLIPLITEAEEQVARHFPGQPLCLEVERDPESTSRQLVASIPHAGSVEDAIERLDRLDSAWWYNAVQRAQGLLCITVAYEREV